MGGQNEHNAAASVVATVAVSVGLAIYPVIVYFGLRYSTTLLIALVLAALCIGRLIMTRARGRDTRTGVVAICCAGIALAAISTIRRSPDAILLYPVIVNVLLLAFFSYSLVRPPTVIEKIARIRDQRPSPEAVAYMRRVTVAWTVFFLCNGAIALYTARFASIETWTLYNGFIAYLLMGLMFGGEWLVRRAVLRAQRK